MNMERTWTGMISELYHRHGLNCKLHEIYTFSVSGISFRIFFEIFSTFQVNFIETPQLL